MTRPTQRTGFKRLAASLMLSAAIVGTGLTAADAETLRWARVGDALTLDPHSANEGPTSALLRNVYQTLVDRDINGQLQPLLATEWFIHPDDPTVWVFKLRQGVKFHDGADFTAEDVVASVTRVTSETSDFKGLHTVVTGAEAIDDYTVHIKTSGPSPLYVQNLTGFFIIDKGWIEANDVVLPQDFKAGEEKFSVRNTNGTGPFILESRDPEVRTVLKQNPNYWGDKPDVTEIVYTPIKEAATRVAALLSGEVDFVQDVPVQDIERLSQTPGITIQIGPENRTIFFAYDMTSDSLKSLPGDNPFKKPQVREALANIIDRDAIKQVVMRGQSVPGAQNAPPFVNGYRAELDAYGKPDLDRAKALLAEAGYPNGFSVDLHCPNDRYLNDEAICQAFVGMMGRAGIKANLVSQSRTIHFPAVQNGQVDFYLVGWGVPTYDSQYIFDFLVHTQDGKRGGWNGSRYNNAEVDAMIQSLATETDIPKRDATIAKIWDKLHEDRVFLMVHNQVLAYATKAGLEIPVYPDNTPRIEKIKIAK